MVELKRDDMQGFLLTSYAQRLTCATYLLLRVTEPENARRWLGEIIGKITPAIPKDEDSALNIAFTSGGLKNLGLSEKDISTFSRAFQEGMTTPQRARTLSDVDDSDPKNWAWGNADKPVDILLLVFALNESVLEAQLKLRRDEIGASGGLSEVISLSGGRRLEIKEHFGFLDGVGQPIIEGTGKEKRQFERTGHATVIKAGEFILGYPNELDVLDNVPGAGGMPKFGENGTYLVFRQMEQHVSEFWNFLKAEAQRLYGTSDSDALEKLGAKIVGRWTSGAPVTKYPDHDPHKGTEDVSEENDFEYAADDHQGFGCPIGAHIRRSNPRDSLPPNPETAKQSAKRHRIIRRGRSYGDHSENVFVDDGKARGLQFICLNSDIERQFEFIQQTWINNKAFGGLYDEVDPLVGRHKSDNLFTIQDDPLRTRVQNLRKFVTVKGGEYFFMPGIRALQYIASLKNA
jgi:Dyp-type peroxidase family